MIQFSKSVYVSVAYRYWNPSWSEAQNRACYGANASAQGVGGNWRLELSLIPESGEDTDIHQPLEFLKSLVDHRCVWLDLQEFSDKPATLENVSLFLAAKVFELPLSHARWQSLTVFEDDHLACTVFHGQEEVQMSFKQANLTLITRSRVEPASGLALDRAAVTREVIKAIGEYESCSSQDDFGVKLFALFKRAVKELRGLRIELGRHGAIEVNSGA